MKKILVTAGAVYGRLDDNKLVGNRTRGIWATRFADYLVEHGHAVTLLVADTMQLDPTKHSGVEVFRHNGFWDYETQCIELAQTHDAAVMAAAVVNWIPRFPIDGKMSTTSISDLKEAFKKSTFKIKLNDGSDVPVPGRTTIDIPFILAPRVIDAMRVENPKLTLIGCKMTIDASRDDMLGAAWKTLIGAKCHAVVANDLRSLRSKTVLYPDGAKFDFDIKDEAVGSFYHHLETIITDEHFHTEGCGSSWSVEKHEYAEARQVFDRIVDVHRQWLTAKHDGTDHVFGAVAARIPGMEGGALCTPRVKTQRLTSADAVDVAPTGTEDFAARRVITVGGVKATMNATLLLRHLDKYPQAAGVVHLHEQLPNVPTAPYAPPGTVRDNLREILGPVYNIDGHGFIAAVNADGTIMYGGR